MFRELLILVRPQNGAIITLSFAAGWLWFANANRDLWIGMAMVYLLHSAGTIKNDIVDLESDKLNMPDRPLVTGKISLAAAEIFFYGFMVLALALAILGGKLFFIWGAIIYFTGWLYNERPFLGSHRPISSIFLLVLYFTTLPLIFGALASNTNNFLFNLNFIILIIGFSLSRAATSLFKDYKDTIGDKATGKKTFLLKFGPAITARVGLLFATIGGILILLVTTTSKGVGPKILLTIFSITLGLLFRAKVALDPTKGTSTFGNIYSNETRLQLSHILWIIWPQ